MAITNGFKPTRRPTDLEVRRVTLANAVGSSALTVGIGTALAPGATGHTRFATAASTSNPIIGIVIGLIYQGNKVSELTSLLGVNASKSTSNPLGGIYSDNETSGDWAVDYIPAYVPISYSATLSAAAETTTNSSGLGWFRTHSTAGAGTLDESSILLFTDTTIASHQFWSNGALTSTSTSIPSGVLGLTA